MRQHFHRPDYFFDYDLTFFPYRNLFRYRFNKYIVLLITAISNNNWGLRNITQQATKWQI